MSLRLTPLDRLTRLALIALAAGWLTSATGALAADAPGNGKLRAKKIDRKTADADRKVILVAPGHEPRNVGPRAQKLRQQVEQKKVAADQKGRQGAPAQAPEAQQVPVFIQQATSRPSLPSPLPPVAAPRKIPFAAMERFRQPVRAFPEFIPPPLMPWAFRQDLVCPDRDESRLGEPSKGYRSRHGDEIWVKGYRLKPVAPGTLFQGADFEDADLRNLELCDLGLEYANLRKARCKGARFRRSRLFAMDTTGSRDLDPTGAERHPVAATVPGEPVGALKFLHLPCRGQAALPRSVVASAEGALYWLEGQSPAVHFVSPYGTVGQLCIVKEQGGILDRPILELYGDAEDNLWLVTERFYAKVSMASTWSSRTELKPLSLVYYLDHPLATVCNTGPGTLLLGYGQTLAWIAPGDGRHPDAQWLLGGLEAFLPATHMVGGFKDDLPILCCISPQAEHAVLVFDPKQPRIDRFELPAEARPHRIACRRDGVPDAFWVTDPGQGAIYRIRLAEGKPRLEPPVLLPQPADPVGIAVSPSGNVWFTECLANRIGVITRDGERVHWVLPPETYPEDIVGFCNGTVRFTCKGQRRIGSFRYSPVAALEEQAEARSVTADGKDLDTAPGPGLAERKAPGPPVGSDRPTARDQAETRDRASEEAGTETENKAEAQAVERPARTAPPIVPPPGRPRTARRQGAPAEASPAEVLAELAITFPEWGLRHIHRRHVPGRSLPGDSTFHPAFTDRAALEALFATTLGRAGGLCKDWYPDGRQRTFLRHTEEVGTCHDPDTRAEVGTRNYLLVTSPKGEVITAFPVP